MTKLKDILKLIAEEKESGFKPLSDLEHAIEQNKKGSDYYDKTKLKNIFNQLSPEDQKEARKKYSKHIKEEEGTGYEKLASMKYKEGSGASPEEIQDTIEFYKDKEFAWKYGAKDDFEGLAQGRMADIKADTYPKWKKQDFQTVINALDKIFKSLNEDFFGISPDILLQGALLTVTLASLGLSVDDAAQPGGILNPDSDEDSKSTYKPDLKTKIKRWWWHLKNDRTVNKIIDRLKTDPEIVDYVNDKNKTGIRSAIEKKLKPEELKYLKILTRDKLK